MRQLTTWVVTALFFAAAGAFSTWLFLHGDEEADEHAAATSEAPAEEEAPAVTRDKNGAVVLRMDEETQQRVGMRVEALQAARDQPQLIAYGSVQEDPSETFTLRAPVAGTIVTSSPGKWPMMGEQLAQGTSVGGLVPRLGPAERVDLESRLATARADVEDARASLVALRASLESKRQLNAGQQKIVSEQALQDAEAKVKSEEARLRAAQETVSTLEASVSAASKPADPISLVVAHAGRVVEVLAHPGESVESGQGLVRVSSFDRLLARVALTAGESVQNIASATVVVAGQEDRPLKVENHLLSPVVDPMAGGQTFLLQFSAKGRNIQPGMPVTARLSLPGEAVQGVVVPPGAIIRYVGAGWVYVKSGADTFVRREVPLIRSTDQGWFVTEGLAPNTPVVVEAAQTLLSEELKFQQGGGEEEEE